MSTGRSWGTDVQGTQSREGEAGRNVPPQRNTRVSPKTMTVSHKLEWIADHAKRYPDMSFNNIMHLIDVKFLSEALRRVNKRAMPGVDGVTAEDYAINITENLNNLLLRLQNGSYRAPPVKRIYIEKEDKSRRPLGLTTYEDKIVQMAVSMLLSAVYEVDFYDFSHGFRKGRSAHGALKEFRDGCNHLKVGMVVDSDVSGCFDNIEHHHLLDFIRLRVSDKNVLRLIGKWLHAGILEGDSLVYPTKGTPQGGVASPLLANIFLHYVLDKWFIEQIAPALTGHAKLVRYADDSMAAFSNENDAKRFMNVLPKRFAKYGLEIHPVKSKLVPFRQPSEYQQKDKHNGTFDFLGFTHYWGKTLKGYWVIKRRTMGKRLRRSIKSVWRWCKTRRHVNIVEQYKILCSKLRGHYQYYGVRCNMRQMEVYYQHVVRAWRRWLGRRHRNGYIAWEKFDNKLKTTYVLPKPKIIHNF